MRSELKCCCGATATFTTQTNGMGEAYDAAKAYNAWVAAHTGCPALFAPQATPLNWPDGTVTSAPTIRGDYIPSIDG